ncbi:WSD1 family O-acyltransferase [Mycobacterium sp. 21AC1]|uniref:WS/DGAT domain-containing protein n=1 Tax=[Mycobacterium] appelbergii TaxID=2939269 RepID=UPI002938E73F|nr:WS/DGAT domain-containing protein [Mycobacterium sp. 21AC1]MDV3124277.1 WSD1 family O-acyltransferase [Mycobacterium sp. 21AC1]
MTVRRLAAIDAQTWWSSTKIPNDQFLLYGFAGVPADLDAALNEVRERARHCAELTLRVRDDCRLTYPAWVSGDVEDDQFTVHALGSPDWNGCLTVVGGLACDQLDATRATWRLHAFPGVRGMPGADGPATVVVLQASHALGDGVRASALAGWLFGRQAPVSPVRSRSFVSAALPWRTVRAARAHRLLVSDTECGRVAAQAESRPLLRSNSRPAGARRLRTITRHRAELPGPTVTIGVLAAVSTALSEHLRTFGDDPSALGAEVPMAKPGARRALNHFGNVGIGLYPDLSWDARIARIVEDFAERRQRAAHPAMLASGRAFEATPAPLLRWGVAQFDPTVRPATVSGNTVLSSVNRGAADLHFGGAPVAVTAGYPALSPMMGLTHGVHGIGDTVAISLHAAESAVGDIDAYLERLDRALR